MLQMFQDAKYRIIPRRRPMMGLSLLVILIGVASLVVKGGPNYGIDFKGGYKFIIQFTEPVHLGDVRQAVNDMGFSGSQVSDFGRSDEVLVVLPAADEMSGVSDDEKGDAIQSALTEGIREHFADNPVLEISQEKVGPKIGNELRRQALWAILYSLLGIIVYITWRFEFKFSIAAIAALVHDVVITLGFFSLLNKEINLTILGALLTIVGYSLNDTIVVFDRIRENLKARRRDDAYDEVINTSINQTLSRTVITSGTTLIVVLFLFLFGGAVIHDFAFALLVGIIVGTYSSIFVASPVLVEWHASDRKRRARKLAAA